MSKATRSAQPVLTRKLSNGRRKNWSEADKARLISFLKHEKLHHSATFELGKDFSQDSTWSRVSQRLVDENREFSPERCRNIYVTMLKEVGRIEYMLGLKGIGWNDKTMKLTGSDEAFAGDHIKQMHSRFRNTAFPYLDNILQIEGKRALVRDKDDESEDEKEEEQDQRQEEDRQQRQEVQDEDDVQEVANPQKKSAKKNGKPGGKASKQPEKKDDNKRNKKSASQTDKPSGRHKSKPPLNLSKPAPSAPIPTTKPAKQPIELDIDDPAGKVLHIPFADASSDDAPADADADDLPLADTQRLKHSKAKNRKRASESPAASPTSERKHKQTKITSFSAAGKVGMSSAEKREGGRKVKGKEVAKKGKVEVEVEARSVNDADAEVEADGDVEGDADADADAEGDKGKNLDPPPYDAHLRGPQDSATKLPTPAPTPSKLPPPPPHHHSSLSPSSPPTTDIAPLTPNPRDPAITAIRLEPALSALGKVSLISLFLNDPHAAEVYLRVVEDPELCRAYFESTLLEMGKELEKCLTYDVE